MKKLIFISFAILNFKAIAQNSFKTESISIFKDGSSFVQKSGNVNTFNNTFSFKGDLIPQALFGTFWVSSNKSKINEVVSYTDTLRKSTTTPSQNIIEILDAMNGKMVKIKIQFLQEKTEGKIIDIGYQENDKSIVDNTNLLFDTKIPTFIHFVTNENKHKYLMAKDIEYIETDEEVKSVFTKNLKNLYLH